jgi:hypothetical protein
VPADVFTAFIDPAGTHYFFAAALGPDNGLWMNSGLSVASFSGAYLTRVDDLATVSTLTHYPTSPYTTMAQDLISMGGYLWTIGQVGTVFYLLRIDTSGGITAYSLGAGSVNAYQLSFQNNGLMVLGPDGNFWVVSAGTTPGVLRITPTGTVTVFALSGTGTMIAVASDGTNLWVDYNGGSNNLQEINTAGTVLNTYTISPHPTQGLAIGGGYLFGMTILSGGDARIWYAPLSAPATVSTYTTSSPAQYDGSFWDGTSMWITLNTSGFFFGNTVQLTPPSFATIYEYNSYSGGANYGGPTGLDVPAVPALDATGQLYIPDAFLTDWAVVLRPAEGLVMLP